MEERITFLVSLPKDLVRALEAEAKETARRHRSPQLEHILRERYNNTPISAHPETSEQPRKRRRAA